MSNDHWDFQKNHDAAHANGMGEYFDERWAWAKQTYPWIDWSDMCVFRAQALVADMPDDPKFDDMVKRALLVAEPSAVDALTDGALAEALGKPVEKDTKEIVVLPSAVFFMDGRIRRAVMIAASYATLTGIKLCRLAGGAPELILATPEGRVVLDLGDAREGLGRMMRLEVGNDATTMPAAGAVGPYFTDEDLKPRYSN